MSFSGSVPGTQMTTAQLRDALTRAAREQPGAWNHLFRGLQTFAESQVRKYLGFKPWQEQNESIQTVLMYLWKDRAWVMQYEPGADPVPYVLQIVRRSVYRCMRDSNTPKAHREVLQIDPDQPLEPEPAETLTGALEQALENRASLEQVAKWMNSLSDRDKKLFGLRWFEDVSAKEVATLLGMKEDAVHQQFKRLLADLKRTLASIGITFLLALLVWSLPLFAAWVGR